MKKITTLLAFMMMFSVSFTFVSCDDDDDIADTLWGTWEGDLYATGIYDGYTYRAAYSTLSFDKSFYDYASGSGYWIDYYSNAPWDYYASHITWSVNNGVITIYSIEDDTYYDIYSYSLSGNYFSGTLEDEFGTRMDFRLTKTSSPYWDDYDWGWGHYGRGPRYSNKKAKETVVPFDDKSGDKPVRRILPRTEKQ